MHSINLHWTDPSNGEKRRKQFLLPMRIGRTTSADLMLRDSCVSRWHAELRYQQGQVVIVDLQSMNGTYVGGRRIERSALSDGETLRIGAIELSITIETLRDNVSALAYASEWEQESHLTVIPTAAHPIDSVPRWMPASLSSSYTTSGSYGEGLDNDASDTVPFESPKLLAQFDNGYIAGVAWSPDRARFALATSLGVSLRDTETFDELHFFALNAPVEHVAFACDGATLLTIARHQLSAWALREGAPERRSFELPYGEVTLAPNGDIYALDLGEHVEIFRTGDRVPICTLPITTVAPQGCLCFDTYGTMLAAATENGVEIWSVTEVATLRILPALTRSIDSIAFSLDGRLLAIADAGDVSLWEMPSGRYIHTIWGKAGRLRNLRFAPGGNLLAATSPSSALLWRVDDGALLRALETPSGHLIDLAFSADGKLLSAASREAVLIWRVADGSLLYGHAGHQECVDAVAISPDCRLIATAGKSLHIWRCVDGVLLRSIELVPDHVHSLVFDPSGSVLVGAQNQCINVWEIESGRVLATRLGHYHSPVGIMCVDDGCAVVSATHNVIEQWEWLNDETHEFQGNPYTTTPEIVLAPNTDLMAVLADNVICLRRISDGVALGIYTAPGPINSITLASDGTFLAAGLDDSVYVWFCGNPETRYVLKQGAERIEFSPDATMFATIRGSVIYVWRTSDGQAYGTLAGHTDRIRTITFSHDNRIIASASCDGTVRLWDL
jgi:WD40 repeat protein